MRIERVEDGYMAYVGTLSRHFSTLHEAVLWAEKQVYVCNTKSEDRYDIVLHFVKGGETDGNENAD